MQIVIFACQEVTARNVNQVEPRIARIVEIAKAELVLSAVIFLTLIHRRISVVVN